MEKVKKVMFVIGMAVVACVFLPLAVYAADYYPDPSVPGSISTAIWAGKYDTSNPHTIHLSGTYTEFADTSELAEPYSSRLDGLTFDGGGTAVWNSPAAHGACLYAGTTDNMVIKGINFVSTTAGNNMVALIDSDNAKVINCTFTGGGWGVAVIQGWDSATGYTFEVSGCTMTNVASGVQAWAAHQAIVKDNTITPVVSSHPAIWIGSPSGVGGDVVDGNDVAGNSYVGWPGIFMQSRPNPTVSNNTVTGFSWGVHTGLSNEPTITGNTLIGNTNGISVSTPAEGATISYNVIAYTGDYGILADRLGLTGWTPPLFLNLGTKWSSIKNNTVYGINYVGSGNAMWLAGTGNVDISDNILASTYLGIVGWDPYPIGGLWTWGVYNTGDYNASWKNNGAHWYAAYTPNTHDLQDVDPKFASENPASPAFLYLSCATPDSILTGSSEGSYRGALPCAAVPGAADLVALAAELSPEVDLACPPTGSYGNHGEYVSCVAETVEGLVAELLETCCVTTDEAEELSSMLVSPRAKSDVGKSNRGKNSGNNPGSGGNRGW